ncbi:MAG: hypothetical protein GF403_08215 [Candidatus Coatesbacteria bacterium]|nr:hypothetical protein [Candidatus Coatesbacteria bacterium]
MKTSLSRLALLLLTALLVGSAVTWAEETPVEKPPVFLSGAEGGQLETLAAEWPRLEPLPEGYHQADPYPRLRELLEGEGALLLVELRDSPTGLAVTARLIAPGGYDEELGSIYTTDDPVHLLTALRSLWERAESSTVDGDGAETYRQTVDKLSDELVTLSGYGTAYVRDDLPPERAQINVQQQAYQQAVDDFLTRLEDRLYLESRLDERTYLATLALVRSGLYVFNNQRRAGDQAFTVEVRLKPEVIRTLTRLLYRGLAA